MTASDSSASTPTPDVDELILLLEAAARRMGRYARPETSSLRPLIYFREPEGARFQQTVFNEAVTRTAEFRVDAPVA